MKESTIEKICSNLKKNTNVHHKWSDYNELVIEKQLPYLCLYRFVDEPDEDFVKIVKTQPAYLIIQQDQEVRKLLFTLAEVTSSKLNAFMLVELWPGQPQSKTFKIFCPQGEGYSTIESLQDSLAVVAGPDGPSQIEVISEAIGSPPSLEPLVSTLEESLEIGFLPISFEIPPLYGKKDSKPFNEIYFRGFQSVLSDTLKKAAFEFMRVQTPIKFNHHLMLGKTQVNDAVIDIDRHLSDLSNRINFLLLVTPINTNQQWTLFEKNKFKEPPDFSYRLINIDPELEQKGLYDLRMSKINSPVFSFILREKRLELDKQLNMLEERESKSFRYMSQSLYGVPSDDVIKKAKTILKDLKVKKSKATKRLNCHEFAALAQEELDEFMKKFKGQRLSIEIRKDISSLMVSKNKLLIGEKVNISKQRAEALIQHEVGTHLLTFCNGERQVLGQLASGFAGYDDLQEGLAVLAEHLVGGLTLSRLRTLAARVLAVDAMVKGAEFIEVFNLLTDKCGVKPRQAFLITTRVMRGGGFTKDAVYLSGLLELLDYLQAGGNMEVLFAGKFSFRHIPLIQELLQRKILKNPFLPTYFSGEEFSKRLHNLKLKTNLKNLLN